jgi:hypothetical protein
MPSFLTEADGRQNKQAYRKKAGFHTESDLLLVRA